MNILGIGAHPDDLEILCGGTLAKYSASGHKVSMVIITDGSAGSTQFSIEELKKIRHDEAEKAAKLIHADFFWLDYPDEFFFDNESSRIKILDLIRQTKPDVIITHAPSDYHPDHQTVSKAVLYASFISTLPNIKSDNEVHEVVCPIYYMDTLAGVNFQPHEYVDITEYFEMKKKMLSCHSSQIKWLKAHDDVAILEFIETTAKYRGYQTGVKYAEGFQIAPYWLRLKPARLLP